MELVAQREIQVSHHKKRSLRHTGSVLGQLAVVSSTEHRAENRSISQVLTSVDQLLGKQLRMLSWIASSLVKLLTGDVCPIWSLVSMTVVLTYVYSSLAPHRCMHPVLSGAIWLL